MPLLLWLDSLDGATCWRCVAKDWRARDDGENCTVECARAAECVTGTMVQFAESGVALGAQGARATCRTSGRGGALSSGLSSSSESV